jgi:sugar fermentation stimulation protein A
MNIGRYQRMVTALVFCERLLEATYLNRLNCFLALVKIANKNSLSFLPNPGRMNELLKPGAKVILKMVTKRGRKTSFDLIGVLHQNQVVSVDSRIPNKLVFEALKKGDIEELKGYTKIRPEYNFNGVRFDFLLTNNSKPCLLEVKSCTFVKDGRALFPDAVTVRGRKHMEELAEAVRRGYRACVLFIVQRNDAVVLSPNDEVDPMFGEAIRKAVKKGVEVYAYYSEFDGNKILLKGKIEIEL